VSELSQQQWMSVAVFATVLAITVLNVIYPQAFWYFKEGWKVKGPSRPSGLWIFFSRLGSLLALAVFVKMLIDGDLKKIVLSP
jgi:hypothetical protein